MLSGSDLVHNLYQHLRDDKTIKDLFEEEVETKPENKEEEESKEEREECKKKDEEGVDGEEKKEEPVAEGKVPDINASDEDKIKMLIESGKGFVILDKVKFELAKKGSNVAVFESFEIAETFAKENKYERYQVLSVRDSKVTEQEKIPAQAGDLADPVHNKTEKIPDAVGDLAQASKNASVATASAGGVGGTEKAENPGTPEPEAAGAVAISRVGKQGNMSAAEKNQKMLLDSRIKDAVERVILVQHLTEEAKGRELTEKEKNFIAETEKIELTEEDRVKVKEAYLVLSKKYKKAIK